MFASAAIIATMLVAIIKIHWEKGFFIQNGGYEYPLVVGAVAAALAFTGPGYLSIDAIAGLRFAGVKWGLIAIGLGVLGALPPMSARPAESSSRATT